MKFAASLVLAAVAACIASPASAQFAKPEDAIKYRQSALFVMGQHFGRIGAMVNGKAPYDAKEAANSAEIVSTVSHLPWAGFGPGTDKGRETRAKPEIWTDQAKFKEAQDKLMSETGKLAAAAKSNSMDSLKPAFTATAGACKNCHDNFRKDQQ
jgi:cytochrome c556